MAKQEDNVQWITVKGVHIPIGAGETKEQAIAKHFNKQADEKERQIAANKAEGDEKNGKGFNSQQYFNRDMFAQVNDLKEGVDNNVIQGFQYYATGVYQEGGQGTGNALKDKQLFDEKYGLSKFIDSNNDKHFTDNPTLYRGAVMTDEEFNKLSAGGAIKDLQGLTSWSTREMVAHMYAEQSDSVWGARGEKRVVFIDQSSTNDAVPNPFTYPANEAMRSSSNSYTIDKIVDVSNYKTALGRENDGNYYNHPVYYVYVKRKGKK